MTLLRCLLTFKTDEQNGPLFRNKSSNTKQIEICGKSTIVVSLVRRQEFEFN